MIASSTGPDLSASSFQASTPSLDILGSASDGSGPSPDILGSGGGAEQSGFAISAGGLEVPGDLEISANIKTVLENLMVHPAGKMAIEALLGEKSKF